MFLLQCSGLCQDMVGMCQDFFKEMLGFVSVCVCSGFSCVYFMELVEVL